jgi:hypothetical protein
MKKNYFTKKLMAASMLLAVSMGMASCSEFLDEVLGTTDNPTTQPTTQPTTPTTPDPDATMKSTPLTLEAKTAGAVVKFMANENAVAKDIEYSTDGGTTWTAGNTAAPGVSVTLTNVGDKVMFRGTTNTYAVVIPGTSPSNPGTYQWNNISCTEDCYVYGNIMSLVDATNFATNTSLPTGTYTFYNLFYDNSKIYNHDTKTLELPATTLVNYCYKYLFQNCTSLTKAPELPATTLAEGCYEQMFWHCEALTTAPELPATTLANNCYSYMFAFCSALTTAPALPATTLAEICYSGMFFYCTALTTAPALPATTLQTKCYSMLFMGCSALTTAPVLPAGGDSGSLAEGCYNGMFCDCTSLEKAPELPATELKTFCYASMFYGCTSLEETPKLPATDLKAQCYEDMFSNCTSLKEAWVKGAYTITNDECKNMFNGCTDASTSTFHSADAANYKAAFTALTNWTAAAY